MCLERALLLVREGERRPVILTIHDDNMAIRMTTQIGTMNEDIDVSKNGKDIMIGLNPKFVLDALRVIDDENIDLYMVNPKSPVFIRDEALAYTYLILPVNFAAVN